MTATQIIEEIKRLDPQQQLGVIRFAYQLDAERQLTGDELSSLAERMVRTTDPAEQARILDHIIRGFYVNDNMSNIRRQNVPPAFLNHLLDRITERQISPNQLGEFADWRVTEPEVPGGRWFKRFPEMIGVRRGCEKQQRKFTKTRILFARYKH